MPSSAWKGTKGSFTVPVAVQVKGKRWKRLETRAEARRANEGGHGDSEGAKARQRE